MRDGFNQGWIEFERNGAEQAFGKTPFETVAAEPVKRASAGSAG